MKSLVLIAALIVSAQASARSMAPLVCSQGEIGEDSYVSVSLLGNRAEFQMHETFITAEPAQTRSSGDTIAILDQEIKAAAEGDEFSVKVNALLVYDRAKRELNTTLVLDGHAVLAGRVLKCK